MVNHNPLINNLVKYLLFALLIGFAQWGVAQSPATGELKIEVRDNSTGRPIEAARIRIVSRQGKTVSVSSDISGTAKAEGLSPGLFEVIISHPNYLAMRLPSERVSADKIIVVRAGLQATEGRDLEEVVVTGELVTGSDLNSVGVRAIDREALRSTAGSGSDVLRALDGLPGLFSDGQYSSYTVRGNGPRDNLILVDGIPFDNVVHFQDSFGDQEEVEGGGRYSVFAPNVVAGAEFFPGGWDAAYGGKSGSLLKLEVADGNTETASYTARLDIAGVEIGYDGPSRLLENTSLLLSARKYNFERLFETVGIEDLGAPELTDVILKTHTDLNSDNELNFLLIHAPESFTRDISNVLASDEDTPGVYEDVELAKIDRDNNLFGATWSSFVGNNARLENRFYYRRFDESSELGEAYPDQVEPGSPVSAIETRADILRSSRQEQETGWRVDYFAENGLGEYTAGARVVRLRMDFNLELTEDWIRYEYDSDDFRPDSAQLYVVWTPELVNNHYQQTATNYTAFFDQQVGWGPLDMRFGMRLDRDNFSKQDLLAPRAAATWYPSARTRMTLTGGRYYQAPDFSDRAADQNNSGLKNERIDQLSLGFEYTTDRDIRLFIEPYYQRLQDLVVQSDGVDKRYSNSGNGKSTGVDMAIGREFRDGWSADLKYSFNSAEIKTNQTMPTVDADFNRPHNFSIGGVWEINERWKLSSRWKWASGRPRDAYIIHENVLNGEPLRYSIEYTERNVERYDAFSALNFRADYQRDFGPVSLIAFIDVINLLGSDNPNSIDFNERSGRLLPDDGSALPLFGIRLEW